MSFLCKTKCLDIVGIKRLFSLYTSAGKIAFPATTTVHNVRIPVGDGKLFLFKPLSYRFLDSPINKPRSGREPR